MIEMQTAGTEAVKRLPNVFRSATCRTHESRAATWANEKAYVALISNACASLTKTALEPNKMFQLSGEKPWQTSEFNMHSATLLQMARRAPRVDADGDMNNDPNLCIQVVAEFLLFLTVLLFDVFELLCKTRFVEHVLDTVQQFGTVSDPSDQQIAAALVEKLRPRPPVLVLNL
jgi:hypothetical protein